MKNWVKNINSIDWWIGIVVVGIIINLLAAYLKLPIDRILSVVSKWWATRTEIKSKERDERIDRLSSSNKEQLFALVQALHVRVRSIMMIILGFIFMFTSLAIKLYKYTEGNWEDYLISVPVYIVSLIFIMAGLRDYLEVIGSRNEIYEARNRLPNKIVK